MAPELISGWEYDEGVDIWSIGITTVIMLTKQCPTTNPSTLLEKSKLDALIDWFTNTLLENRRLSASARSFVSLCLEKERTKRLSAPSAMTHMWLHESG